LDHATKRGDLGKTTKPIGHGGTTLTTVVTCENSGENAKAALDDARRAASFERSRWRSQPGISVHQMRERPMDGLTIRLNARAWQIGAAGRVGV